MTRKTFDPVAKPEPLQTQNQSLGIQSEEKPQPQMKLLHSWLPSSLFQPPLSLIYPTPCMIDLQTTLQSYTHIFYLNSPEKRMQAHCG